MSVTSRLVLIVLLALLGLGAATTAVFRARSESDTVREATAAAQADSVAQQLLAQRDALSSGVADAIARGESAPPALGAFTAALLRPLADASAGYCLRDGTLVVRETVAPRDVSPPLPGQRSPPDDDDPRDDVRRLDGPRLLPLDRDVVVAACRSHERGSPSPVRFVAPNDLLLISIAGGHEPFAAWALVRTPKRVHTSDALSSPLLVAVIALSMVALVALCVDTVLKIRKGIGAIADTLVAVQADLGTPIPRPATRELARIADGLRAMTAHLSDARERELALERRLSHERRLASLGRVAAGIAHEIRNPLAGMKLCLDAMARRRLDERSTRDVARSLGEVARVDAVVRSLLLIARREPAPVEDVDLAAFVDKSLAALVAFSSSRAIRIVRNGAACARIDPVGMARVIDNLVRNGVEASPEGGEVVVELGVSDGDVVLRVVDRGAGVSAARGREGQPRPRLAPARGSTRAALYPHGGARDLRRGRRREVNDFRTRVPRASA